MPEQPEKVQDLEARLTAKAREDEAFKQTLLSDPKAVIAGELGREFPAGLEIEVLEETATKIYLVLPAKSSEGELSDAQIEAIAGGGLAPSPFRARRASKSAYGFSRLSSLFISSEPPVP